MIQRWSSTASLSEPANSRIPIPAAATTQPMTSTERIRNRNLVKFESESMKSGINSCRQQHGAATDPRVPDWPAPSGILPNRDRNARMPLGRSVRVERSNQTLGCHSLSRSCFGLPQIRLCGTWSDFQRGFEWHLLPVIHKYSLPLKDWTAFRMLRLVRFSAEYDPKYRHSGNLACFRWFNCVAPQGG